MGIVVFNPTNFKSQFPEFATVSDGALGVDFSFATTLLNNTDRSLVKDLPIRAALLNMLTAHIAALLNGVNGETPTQLVGRISSAREGSVSVSSDMGPVTNSQAWYMQTKYGAMYWTMSAPYRSFLYVAPPSGPVVFVPQG